MNVEEISFKIILHGGNARTLAMEAISYAKKDEYKDAKQKLEAANKEVNQAHQYQTDLIQGETRGEKTEIRLLLVHAQDHLMNAMTVIDLAKEFVELYETVNSKEDLYDKKET